jgi:hypothetical protein
MKKLRIFAVLALGAAAPAIGNSPTTFTNPVVNKLGGCPEMQEGLCSASYIEGGFMTLLQNKDATHRTRTVLAPWGVEIVEESWEGWIWWPTFKKDVRWADLN